MASQSTVAAENSSQVSERTITPESPGFGGDFSLYDPESLLMSEESFSMNLVDIDDLDLTPSGPIPIVRSQRHGRCHLPTGRGILSS